MPAFAIERGMAQLMGDDAANVDRINQHWVHEDMSPTVIALLGRVADTNVAFAPLLGLPTDIQICFGSL
jgi:hypothetical protein